MQQEFFVDSKTMIKNIPPSGRAIFPPISARLQGYLGDITLASAKDKTINCAVQRCDLNIHHT